MLEDQVKTVKGRDQKFLERMSASRIALKDGNFGQSDMRQEARTPIYILMAATALVLLIAMANAANLMLARSAQRRRELAIRAALGAGRGDIMGQLLVEALLMAAGGGVAASVRLLDRPRDRRHAVRWRDEGLRNRARHGLARGAVCTRHFGRIGPFLRVIPGLGGGASIARDTLKDAAGQTTAGTGFARVRQVLVCAQVAISALLLIPTGLFLKSLVNILQVDLGLKNRERDHLRYLAGAKRLQTREVAMFSSGWKQELRACPVSRTSQRRWVPLFQAATGAMMSTPKATRKVRTSTTIPCSISSVRDSSRRLERR